MCVGGVTIDNKWCIIAMAARVVALAANGILWWGRVVTFATVDYVRGDAVVMALGTNSVLCWAYVGQQL